MLILNGEILDRYVSMPEVIEAMEQAFLVQAENRFTQPDRLQYPNEHGVFLLMPCFMDDAFSTKLVTVYPHNQQHGLPATMAAVLLNDTLTGQPLAMLNGTYLTGIRTGAVGGVSVKYLARPDAARVGVVGAGTQGMFQVLAAAAVRPITDVYVYDRFPAALESYAARLHAKRPDLKVHTAESAEDAAAQADVIIVCSTATEPVFPDDPALFAGKHIVAIGSYQPHTRELPRAALANAAGVWLDTMYAAEESGDLAIPLTEGWLQRQRLQPFCDIVSAGAAPQGMESAQTVFKSVGIGLFDLMAAKKIYEKALRENFGQNINL